MNNFRLKSAKLLLFLGDIGLLFLSLWLTLIIRYQATYQAAIWQRHWPIFAFLFFFWLLIFYAFNLYDFNVARDNFDYLTNYFKAIIVNIGLAVVYFYLLANTTAIAPKTILAILIVIFSLASFGYRKFLLQIAKKSFSQNLLFVGYEPLIKELLPFGRRQERFGFYYKGIVLPETLKDPEINLDQYNFNQIMEVIKKEKINLVVINEPGNQQLTDLLFKILPLRINFSSLTNFYENVTRRVPLKIISRGWFLDNFSEGNKFIFEFLKRLVDLIISTIFIVLSLPFVPFIILAIVLDSKGKIIFKQIRLGKDGQTFTALKFRTMYQNAEKTGPQWAKENDPRITRVGRFLRKIRLDEIPQLINILKGDMSFVGPRPERPEFIEQLATTIPFYRERLLVKPGLTGWAQINFPYADSVDLSLKKLQYDLYYVKHRSLFLDFSIALKTLNTILKGGGR